MKIRASVILADEVVEGIMQEAKLNAPQEVVVFLKGLYLAEFPQYADDLVIEAIEESEVAE